MQDSYRLAGPRVLLVDDDPDVLESISLLLRLRGYLVDEALDGPQAVAIARRRPPAVVIMDVRLPGMNGFAVAAVLRRELGLRDARLIAISGYSAPLFPILAEQSGVDFYLRKPVEPDVLIALMPPVDSEFGEGCPNVGFSRQASRKLAGGPLSSVLR